MPFWADCSQRMHLGKSNDFSIYHTRNHQKVLPSVEEERDLGIVIDNQLKFVKHIQSNIKIANRNLGIIKRTFSYVDYEVFLNFYKSLVRSHLEYGSCVWSFMDKKDCTAPENVQRREPGWLDHQRREPG